MKLSALVCHGISFMGLAQRKKMVLSQSPCHRTDMGVPVLKQVLVDEQSTPVLTHKWAQIGECTVQSSSQDCCGHSEGAGDANV